MHPDRLSQLPAVQAARARLATGGPAVLEEQLRIVRIPAPSLDERERSAYLERRFREIGLHDVTRDEVGNVLGQLPRPADPAAPPALLAAHLDTVFSRGTELEPRVEGERIYAPGIADNARGLAATLAVAGALVESGVSTARPVWFAGTVGEEGNGDLRGVKHLFRDASPFRKAAAFLSIDGTGLRRVVHRAIGARRVRISMTGPGGHSWADWGAANAIHTLGTAIARMSELVVPADPRTTLTVARVGGGTSINSIPAEAWMEVDLRSEDPRSLARLAEAVEREVRAAAQVENARRRPDSPSLRVEMHVIGDRPAGATREEAPIVQAAMWATRSVGARPELSASSTDANVPISLGIPSVTLGAGGESGGIHTLGEWYTDRDSTRALERALLTLLAVAQPAAPSTTE
jgi:acetylornithine deacetylase/succinyl-diaminopimelate desuccinylase-like protein